MLNEVGGLLCNMCTKRKKQLGETHKTLSAGSIPGTNIFKKKKKKKEKVHQLVVSILNETEKLGKQRS